MTTHRPRKKKKMTKESEFNDEDLISKLPDPLLHHMFSFLDMKFVIQTSILSRRWRYLWISQPFMNFDQMVYNPCIESVDTCDIEAANILFKCFMNFVEKALCLHSTSQIHTFRLSGRDGRDPGSNISHLLPVLARRQVKVIDIQIVTRSGGELDLYLPPCLFSCRSLTTLKLDFSSGCCSSSSRGKMARLLVPVYHRFNSPLPNLQNLHLKSFCLGYEFQNFSKCPVLDNLVISNCTVEEKLSCMFQHKSLTLETSLSNSQIRATIHLLEKCPNLETLVVKMTKEPHPLRECVVVDELDVEVILSQLCQMHHLKVVEIWDVEAAAAQNEFEFVKFLLKNALVLEKVILYTCKTQSPSNNMKLKRFGEKLIALPAISSRIGIFLL